MVVSIFTNTLRKVIGSRNDRLVKGYYRRVAMINEWEPKVRGLDDEQLKAKTGEFRQRLTQGDEKISAIMPEVLAVAREVMDRAVGIRNIFNPEHHFDPQRLPEAVRGVYGQVLEQVQATPEAEELGCSVPVPGWMQVAVPNEIYDAVRELYPQSKPPFRARPFDVQLIGGMVLSEGKIAEMKTGEGKTIVAPLACYVACIEGLQCHVVTVNDYLVQRDRDWVFPFYYHLGLTVGAIHPFHMQHPTVKMQAYQCNTVYGTNSEFGFDYLRDNMKMTVAEQVQRQRGFCIVDEVDSILVDEARTPLIISGPAHEDSPQYELADDIARHLIQKQRQWDGADEQIDKVKMRIKGLEGDIRNAREKAKIPPMKEEMKKLQQELPGLEVARDQHVQYYEVERERKAVHLTHEGVAEAQKKANIGSFYVGNNMEFPHLLENALRAHVVYQRDKDYVVQNGDVVIVDEFTGRLMIGRQWSDGLHQAVEAKEKVKIKQETQTLATVTIQNYFKLYKRLGGMTGTAITEATEFDEIYGMDVVCIPTNRPVVRQDQDDLVFLSQKDKWEAILDEIHRVHAVGRPVLVGTASVDNSEMLSGLLTRKYAIKHEVLNAKQHEREAHIVEHAGELAAVMIATNMAGRGTDIKLAPIDRAALVAHWQKQNLLPRQAKPEMADEELVKTSYRHQAVATLHLKPKDVEAMSDDEVRLGLLRQWAKSNVLMDDAKIDRLSEDELMKQLDRVPQFMLHRLKVYKNIEEMGGLHIVGTERHEARRIDNQLRGRAGRQGDQGSSRFFIALDDDLMKLFAGKVTMTALSKLGMKEGDAIENPLITRSVSRAQRKVEERNYEIRKNLLEYDEVMEHQRHAFYGIRQDVLEGNGVEQLIFEYIAEAVDDAVGTYLHPEYVQTQIAEWCRTTVDVSVEPDRLRTDDLAELQQQIVHEARAEVVATVGVTLGEYMSNELPPEEWDLRGLSQWAMSRFHVDLKQNQLRQMNVTEVEKMLVEAAQEQIGHKDLSGVAKFLEPLYAQRGLAEWAKLKFNIELDPAQLAELERPEVGQSILDHAREAYKQREVNYPVEFVLEMVFQAAQQSGPWAAEQLAAWANQKYELGWTAEEVAKIPVRGLHQKLSEASQEWLRGGKLEACVDQAIKEHADPAKLAEWAQNRFLQPIDAAELQPLDGQKKRDLLLDLGRTLLRAELTQLERFVLLQILDHTWKDHLYAMDQLKDSIGLRGYAERDPRIEYKREGANLFEQMQKTVRDRVTDLIFRAKLTANVQMQSVYSGQQAQHAPPGPPPGRPGPGASGTSSDQGRGGASGNHPGATTGGAQGSEGGQDQPQFASRKQRRAAAAREAKKGKGGRGR